MLDQQRKTGDGKTKAKWKKEAKAKMDATKALADQAKADEEKKEAAKKKRENRSRNSVGEIKFVYKTRSTIVFSK